MKKLSAVLLAFALVFSNVGTVVFHDSGDVTVEAKSYKSGKKGFSGTTFPSKNRVTNDDTNKNNNVNKSTTNQNSNKTGTSTTKGGFSSGGLMKGLLVGGLAGLLFGSLFADMGILGSLLGLMINLGAILLIAYLIMKIYFMLKRKNEKEVTEHWRR
ncbi:hypothetical protein [Ureibacillus sp. FSL K6-3587]|jgi:predicted lipid-binding transport protein (Tim44 family)|uniref:hypothetical protein n=1 Tax=Ureibacillus sp. FSL K6-3587 TaxID=2954681 RepID=UPI0031580405